jgi:hypothetical protein
VTPIQVIPGQVYGVRYRAVIVMVKSEEEYEQGVTCGIDDDF